MTLVLNNAKVFRSGVFSRSSVSISLGNGVSRGGTISTMDASSFVILPGFVDVHVHLREPGFSYKETISSGTLAAAHGGYSSTNVISASAAAGVGRDADSAARMLP